MATTSSRLAALEADVANLKAWKSAHLNGHVLSGHTHPDDATDADIAALDTRIDALDTNGGSTSTVTPTSTADLTLPASTTAVQFETAIANPNYAIIELAGGTYTWDAVQIAGDFTRAGDKLLVRPVANARCRFAGAGVQTYGIFRHGSPQGVIARNIKFDGVLADGIIFDGVILNQAGVLALFGTDGVTWRNYTARNLKRGANATSSAHAWVAYISAPYSRANTNLLLDRGTLEAPAVLRDVSAYQIASNVDKGTHGQVDITNQRITGYAFAGYFNAPVDDLALANWTVDNCGRNGRSVEFGATVHGTYRDVVLTGSDPILNQSGGSMVEV